MKVHPFDFNFNQATRQNSNQAKKIYMANIQYMNKYTQRSKNSLSFIKKKKRNEYTKNKLAKSTALITKHIDVMRIFIHQLNSCVLYRPTMI